MDYDVYREYREVQDEIEDILEDMAHEGHSQTEINTERLKLESTEHFKELTHNYQKSQVNEMYCAGMLILGKKENMIFNNFPLRFAVAKGLLDLDQFKDEHQVYDSIEQAMKSHAKS